jgi:outer membrane immunogenic protein
MLFRSITGMTIACGLLLTAFTAHAADMPVKARPVAVAPGWTGFYVGVHTGWGFGDAGSTSRTDIGAVPFFAPASFDLKGNGPLFGGQLGYNWQAGNWVLGVEADISGTGISGLESRVPFRLTGAGTLLTGAESFMRQDVNWLATARGRLGYVWGPGFLYATGGAAWANIDYRANTTEGLDPCGGYGCSLPANFNATRSGWTVGGGYEWAVMSNWSLRGEYLYYNFGGASAAARTLSAGIGATCPACLTTYQWGDLSIHAVRLGLNYRWGGVASAQASMSMPAPVAKDWTGFYAGVHGGWAFGRSSGLLTTAIDRPQGFFLGPNTYSLNDDGPLFGGQVGYNRQVANWIAGIEADISGTGIRAFHAQPPFCPQNASGCFPAGPQFSAGSFLKQDVAWLASLRGRLGHTWGTGMVYVTAGAALAGIDYQANLTDGVGVGPAFPVKTSTTRPGWVAGGGYELPVWSNWTMRGEYLFYRVEDFSATATALSAIGATGCRGDNAAHCSATYRWNDLDVHSLRLGLNYRL